MGLCGYCHYLYWASLPLLSSALCLWQPDLGLHSRRGDWTGVQTRTTGQNAAADPGSPWHGQRKYNRRCFVIFLKMTQDRNQDLHKLLEKEHDVEWDLNLSSFLLNELFFWTRHWRLCIFLKLKWRWVHLPLKCTQVWSGEFPYPGAPCIASYTCMAISAYAPYKCINATRQR